MYIKVFYDKYKSRVNVITGDIHPFMNFIRIYRDDEEIFYSPIEPKELTPLHRPYEFDHDHHTRLFRKMSDHEVCYHDENVQQFQKYRYTVETLCIKDDVLQLKELKIQDVYIE